jgi:competence protein ComFC
MNKDKGDWKKWVGQASRTVLSLLSPRKDECLQCKQSSHLQSEELGLCHVCFKRIPWLRQVLCQTCGRGEQCSDCLRRGQAYFLKNRSAVRYDDTMKDLLARYKYRGDERLKEVVGHMLIHAYRLVQAEAVRDRTSPVREFITFVPVSERRLLERGFNQAEQMAVELGRRVGIPVLPLLHRSKHTDKQSFKKRSERLDDLQHVFELSTVHIELLMNIEQSPCIIYVVDDVYTTGSTMNQCAKVLQESLRADVYGLTWAR